jgi:tetratricopeptide (TPR) repeat protein
MPSPIPQYKIWDEAKILARKFQYAEAIALYSSLESDMKNLMAWSPEKSEEDNLFDQAMFFGDYCGALADAGIYDEAKKNGDLALDFIKQGNFTTLQYIYYNIGNIYLFQQEYAQACAWFESALDGVIFFYSSENRYLVNYGIALYFLGMKDKAKEKFQLAINSSKNTKYNRCFEPFFFMNKIYELQNEEKESQKYKKMYLTRLKKYSQRELEFTTSTMKGKEVTLKDEILADYAAMSSAACPSI